MADISVTLQNAGPQINVDVGSASQEISVSVQGSGPQGQKGEKGDKPEKGVDYWTDSDKAELVQDVLGQLPEISPYEIGSGLKLDESTNTLSVDTAASVEADNTRPITSAAVYTTVGNIEILLETI